MEQFNTPQLRPFLGLVIIIGNKFTRVPIQITLFTQLFQDDLSNNEITTIQSGAFNLTNRLRYLTLRGKGIATIEDGAFQGI